MDNFLKKEPPITASKLLSELTPVLQDYLEGEITCLGTAIKYILPNGQEFLIIARRTA